MKFSVELKQNARSLCGMVKRECFCWFVSFAVFVWVWEWCAMCNLLCCDTALKVRVPARPSYGRVSCVQRKWKKQHFIQFLTRSIPSTQYLKLWVLLLMVVKSAWLNCESGISLPANCEMRALSQWQTDQTRTEEPEETRAGILATLKCLSYNYRCHLSARIRQCASAETRSTKNKYEQNICLSLSCWFIQ